MMKLNVPEQTMRHNLTVVVTMTKRTLARRVSQGVFNGTNDNSNRNLMDEVITDYIGINFNSCMPIKPSLKFNRDSLDPGEGIWADHHLFASSFLAPNSAL